jgi:hypothetical protein
MSNVQVRRRLHRVQAIEAREVIVVVAVVVTAPMAEIEQCVAVVAVVVEATLVVVGAESGCWCEEMHLSLLVQVVRAVAVAVADAFIQVALVDSVNLASHLCLSHL